MAAVLALMAPSMARAGVADCGMITNFASVTGTLTAGSPVPITYNVTASIKVASPNIIIDKVATPTVQGASGTVTFCINFQNLSYCASAINVLITDRVPSYMNSIVGPNFGQWTNGPNNGTAAAEFSPDGITWTAGEPAAVGQYFLRWAFPKLRPRESGVICFRATVL